MTNRVALFRYNETFGPVPEVRDMSCQSTILLTFSRTGHGVKTVGGKPHGKRNGVGGRDDRTADEVTTTAVGDALGRERNDGRRRADRVSGERRPPQRRLVATGPSHRP